MDYIYRRKAELESRVDALKSKVDMLRSEKNDAVDQRDSLSTQLCGETSRSSTLQGKINYVQRELESLKKQISSLTTNNTKLDMIKDDMRVPKQRFDHRKKGAGSRTF